MVEAETQQLLRRQQRHSRLLGRAVALALVAFYAGSDQILRRVFAALSTRKNVIKRQVLRMTMLAAILAAIAVANVNTRTLHRRLAVIAPQMNVMTQPHNRRNRKRRRRRMQHVVAVVLFNKDRAAKPQTHGSCNTDRTERLIRKIQ